jgi:hypothetical protein
MSYTLDHTLAHLLVAGREPCQLRNAAQTTNLVVIDAKRLMEDVAEQAPSDGSYLGQLCDWRLPAVHVTREIIPGDVIFDSDMVAYVVQAVDQPQFNDVWHCYSLRLIALGDTIGIKPPVDSTDAYTSPLTHHSSLPIQACAVQEEDRELVTFQNKRGYRRKFSIWVLTQPELAFGTLLVDGNKVTYVVETVIQKTRIDELCCIKACINP